MDNPTLANGVAEVRGQERSLAACHRHHPNRVDVAVGNDGDDVIVDGALAATDGGGEKGGGLDSLFGDDSHEGHAFHAFRGNLASRSRVNCLAEAADDVVPAAAAVESDGDGVADDDVEVAVVKDPNPRQLRRHYSAMDGLALNDRPPLKNDIKFNKKLKNYLCVFDLSYRRIKHSIPKNGTRAFMSIQYVKRMFREKL